MRWTAARHRRHTKIRNTALKRCQNPACLPLPHLEHGLANKRAGFLDPGGLAQIGKDVIVEGNRGPHTSKIASIDAPFNASSQRSIRPHQRGEKALMRCAEVGEGDFGQCRTKVFIRDYDFCRIGGYKSNIDGRDVVLSH